MGVPFTIPPNDMNISYSTGIDVEDPDIIPCYTSRIGLRLVAAQLPLANLANLGPSKVGGESKV